MTATNFSALIILISSLIFYSNLHGNPIILSENDVEFISTGWISKLRLFVAGSENFVAETRDSRFAILNPCHVYPGLSRLLCKLLLLGGNVMLNPGPHWKFLCSKSANPVKSNQKGIMCDFCDRWYHSQCCSVSTMNDELTNSSCKWICNDCGLANYSNSLFDSQDPVTCEIPSHHCLTPLQCRTLTLLVNLTLNLMAPRALLLQRDQDKQDHINLNAWKLTAIAS